ncbi:MAG: hypothetical protein JXM70_26125 [Pirellulales bacterium]|nr:hypothetical protein [Pirellulales bacterium]
MKSRERALATLNHEQPDDRPCIDFGGSLATGVSAVVYDEAKKLLGYDTVTTVEDIIAQNAMIEPFMLDEMGGDFVLLRCYAPSLGIPVEGFKPSRMTNGKECMQPELYNPVENEQGDLELYGMPRHIDCIHPRRKDDSNDSYCSTVICRCPKGFHSYARAYHPMTNVATIEELDEYVFPEMTQPAYDYYAREARRLRESTDRAVAGLFFGNVFEMGQLYWGYGPFLTNMGIEKDLVMEFMERRTECYMRDLKKYLEAAGQYLDVIQFNDDLGTQQSLLISKKMYREMVKPFHKKMFGYVRDNYPDIKVFFHSCGAVFDMIPEMIDCGVQILNPVQITAEGMHPHKLKKEFGKDLVFWGGGVDTQKVLCRATPEEVANNVKEMLDIFSPGGGYVFSQVHCVEASVPAQNLITCFQTAKGYRHRN